MVAFKVFLLFVLKSVNGIVDSKYILGVERLLDLLHELNCWGGKDVLHESLTHLADTVMVRQAATLLENFFSAFVFNLFVNMNYLVLGNI